MFTIPNLADAFNANQSELDKVDLDVLVAGYALTGVVSGCAVTAQGSPDMTVAVAAGSIIVDGVVVTVASGNVTVGTADATNPRLDLITVNSSGTKACTAGTAAAEPVFPAIPASSVVLAAVYVPANDTTIATNQITDKRILVTPALQAFQSLGNMGASETFTGVASRRVHLDAVADTTTAITISLAATGDIVAQITQDGTGGRKPTWTGAGTWLTQDGAEPDLSIRPAGAVDLFWHYKDANGNTRSVWLTETFTEAFTFALGDETTAIASTGTKITFRAPYAFTLVGVRASVTTASSSGTPTFDVNEGGTSLLSTKLTIDANEKTSTTAAAAAVISDNVVADDAEITIDVDVTGTGTAGAKVTLYVRRR